MQIGLADYVKVKNMGNKDILFSLGTNGFLNPDLIEYISDELGADKRYVIVGRDHEISDFKDKFITIMRSSCIRGEYDYQLTNDTVIDDRIIESMHCYSMDILWMQQRFEDYYDFQINRDLESHLNIYMSHLKFWNGLLSSGRIKYVVFTDVPHEGYDAVIYYLCKLVYKDIKIVLRFDSRIPGRDIVFDDFTKIGIDYGNADKSNYSDEMSQEAQEYYMQLKNSEQQHNINGAFPGPNNREQWLRKRFGRRNILLVFWDQYLHAVNGYPFKFEYKWMKALESAFLCPRVIHQTFKSIPKVLYAIKQKKKTDRFIREYESLALINRAEDIPDCSFIYFAMHYQPEVTSLPLGGGEYGNQRIPIEILSGSIPRDWKILIKKHPGQNTQCANMQNYRLLGKLKNVMIVSENVSSHELMKRAKMVATLTGTVAMEALFLRKKAIVFGYSELLMAPNVFKARTVDECRQIIEADKNTELQYGDEDIKKYFALLSQNSFKKSPETYAKRVIEMLKN